MCLSNRYYFLLHNFFYFLLYHRFHYSSNQSFKRSTSWSLFPYKTIFCLKWFLLLYRIMNWFETLIFNCSLEVGINNSFNLFSLLNISKSLHSRLQSIQKHIVWINHKFIASFILSFILNMILLFWKLSPVIILYFWCPKKRYLYISVLMNFLW